MKQQLSLIALALVACSGQTGTPGGGAGTGTGGASTPGTSTGGTSMAAINTTGTWVGHFSTQNGSVQATMQLTQTASGSIGGTIDAPDLNFKGQLAGELNSGVLQGSDQQGDTLTMNGSFTTSTYRGTATVKSGPSNGDASFEFVKNQ